jgi:hypothetical protein
LIPPFGGSIPPVPDPILRVTELHAMAPKELLMHMSPAAAVKQPECLKFSGHPEKRARLSEAAADSYLS